MSTPRPLAALALALVLAGCGAEPSPTPAATASETPTPSETALLRESSLDPGSAVGAMADDVPQLLADLPDGSEILVTSAKAVSDGMVDVSVNYRVGSPPDDVVAYYDSLLAQAGFAHVDAQATVAPGVDNAYYSKADSGEYLQLVTLPGDEGRTKVSISGHLVAQ